MRTMRIPAHLFFGVVVFASAGMYGQAATGLPAFEVASLKPSRPQSRSIGIYTFPGGRITAENYTLAFLMEEAFSVQRFQILGGSRWIHEDQFDLEAKPPATSKSSKANPPYPKAPPNDEQRQMLQTLLADRFQLKYHRDTKEGPVYLLVKSKKELRLTDAKNKDDYPWVGGIPGGAINGNGIAGINISMPLLAVRLSRYLGRPVLDQTGLQGSFDFKFEYATDDPHSDLISSILTSIQGLGLKLEPAKGPVQTLVVDHAEKPSAN